MSIFFRVSVYMREAQKEAGLMIILLAVVWRQQMAVLLCGCVTKWQNTNSQMVELLCEICVNYFSHHLGCCFQNR